jgi:hypothetical protein
MATAKYGFTPTPSYFKVEDSHDGKRFRYAVAHATLTVGTLYAILPDATNGGNAVTAAIADNAAIYRVGVATEATTTGNVARLQTGGEYESMTTPTLSITTEHTLEIGGGAIVDGAALPMAAANAFGINSGANTSAATSCDVYLLDRELTAST